MYKSITMTIVASGLFLALACGSSGLSTTPTSSSPPRTLGQTEEPSPIPEKGSDPTETPQKGTSTDYSSTPTKTNSNPNTGSGISSFVQSAGSTYPGLLSLPKCDASSQLTMTPLPDDAYNVIIPLGLLATPQHVLPTSHVYYNLVRDTPASGGYGPPAIADVRAPGNIRIIGMNSSETFGGPEGYSIDYDVLFAPCQGRMFQLIHVSTVNSQLKELFEAAESNLCSEYPFGDSQSRFCTKAVNLDVQVGTILGTTGGMKSSALDLEAHDLTGPSLAYANPARYREYDKRLKVACPFDFFTAEIRESQLSRMGDYGQQPRTAEPRCGEVMQDLPGTAQGNWYASDAGTQTDWSKELALVHDNVDPSLATISIGGTVSEHGVWNFPPNSSGVINRDFSGVTADGLTYCYQGALTDQGSQTPIPFPGRLLISLTTDTEMLVERQDGDCAGSTAFANPVTYRR